MHARLVTTGWLTLGAALLALAGCADLGSDEAATLEDGIVDEGALDDLDLLDEGVDRAFHAMALARGRRSRARSRSESLGPNERIDALTRLRALYDDPRLIAEPDAFFGPRPEVVLQRRRVLRVGRRDGEKDECEGDEGSGHRHIRAPAR